MGGHQCAFCGFIKLDSADLAIEAAHIRWTQFGGPDAIDNGLACCSIHHQAFDGEQSLFPRNGCNPGRYGYGAETAGFKGAALVKRQLRLTRSLTTI